MANKKTPEKNPAAAAGIVVAVAVLVLIAVLVGVAINNKHKSDVAKAAGIVNGYKIYKACDILTPAIAKQLVGSDASTQGQPAAQQKDVNESSCTYYGAGSKLVIGLLAKSPLTAATAKANTTAFGTGKPVGVQIIKGYGTSAYWQASYAQLNILDHNVWYVLRYGPSDASQATLTQTEQFANLVKNSL